MTDSKVSEEEEKTSISPVTTQLTQATPKQTSTSSTDIDVFMNVFDSEVPGEEEKTSISLLTTQLTQTTPKQTSTAKSVKSFSSTFSSPLHTLDFSR